MKYRLKKDIPFAKAGAEVRRVDYARITESPRYSWFVEFNEAGEQVKIGDQLCNMSDWIEEVKEPREFEIGISNDGRVEIIGGQHFFFEIQSGLKEIIKVREVID